jgi:PAS domain S-box-containing protein
MSKAQNEICKNPVLARLRRRAETLLRQSPQDGPETPDVRMRYLVHELRVYQSELEMQNEELRCVQLELENSRDRFSKLYDLSPYGYLTLTAEGLVLEANLTAARLLGLDPAELLKKKFSRFIAVKSQDDFYLRQRELFATAKRQSYDLQMRRPDGTSFTTHLESMVETAGPGKAAQCLVALMDVTERVRAELERSQLAAIVDSSDDAIISRDLNDIVTTWNACAERMFGYTASEMVGHNFSVLVPRDQLDEIRRIRASVRHGDWVAHYNTVRVAKDGRHIPVSTTISPVKDAAGALVGVSAIMRDVTAHQKIEETLRQSESALADFFAEAPMGLLWVSANGRILRVNRAQLEMLGCEGEDFSGRHIGEFHTDPEIAKVALDRLMKKETLRNYRAQLCHKDGTIRDVLIDANTLWEQGRLVHSRWFVRDITVRRRLERELLEISERERQRIGHDLHDGLGQQLYGLSYLTALLEKGLQEDASPRVAEARKVNKFFNEALALTRSIAHGLQSVNPAPDGLMLALHELVERTREIYGLDCRFECRAPVLIQRHSAATHLYRIAQEAVNNAMKHGKPTRVRIQLAATPQRIVLGVWDNGVGIRQTAKPSKGMGLHVMQYRADAISGSLAVRRHPRGGTEVVCTVTRQALLAPGKEIK